MLSRSFTNFSVIKISLSKCPISIKAIWESKAVWYLISPVTRASALFSFASASNSLPLPAQKAIRFNLLMFLLFTNLIFGIFNFVLSFKIKSSTDIVENSFILRIFIDTVPTSRTNAIIIIIIYALVGGLVYFIFTYKPLFKTVIAKELMGKVKKIFKKSGDKNEIKKQ